jgi:hypothetical protein
LGTGTTQLSFVELLPFGELVEKRLVPLNALIALLEGYGGWPRQFAGDGLELRWLEVPVTTQLGLVTVDVLAYSSTLNLLLPAEVKSGANAEEDQARKYGSMTTTDILRLVTIREARPDETIIEPMYVVLKENQDRVKLGLDGAGISCHLLVIDANEAELICPPGSRLSPFRVDLPSPPPKIIPLDADSPAEAYLELSITEVIARAASGQRRIALESILEVINPYWAVTHDAVRGAIKTKTRNALREAFQTEFRDNFAWESTSSGHGIIQVLRTPADYDPRGRAQGWQAMEKKASRALKRRPRRRVMPGQASFEDLGREAEAGGP